MLYHRMNLKRQNIIRKRGNLCFKFKNLHQNNFWKRIGKDFNMLVKRNYFLAFLFKIFLGVGDLKHNSHIFCLLINIYMYIHDQIYECEFIYTEVGKRRFTVMSRWNTMYILVFLFILVLYIFPYEQL